MLVSTSLSCWLVEDPSMENSHQKGIYVSILLLDWRVGME